jgi:hypothetical protein
MMGSEIVVRDRLVPRVLAIVPGVVLVLCVRVLTLGNPPVAVRAGAAALVAGTCWIAYRLLTVKVTLGETSIHIRGVLYDADIAYDDLEAAVVSAPGWAVRSLLWGIMRPRAVEFRTRTGRLRPLALVSVEDDDQVRQALRALLVRCGTRLTQRLETTSSR